MMIKRAMVAVAALTLASCGKDSSTSNLPAHVTPVDAVVVDAPPLPDAAPRRWAARAELDPVKGSYADTAFIVFLQIEGDSTSVASSTAVKGLAAGKYHLVVHDGRDCGENAAEAGPPWLGSVDFDLPKKGTAAVINVPGVALSLDGAHSIVGHTLVLHADAKGKPGRVLACGAIFSRSTSSP